MYLVNLIPINFLPIQDVTTQDILLKLNTLLKPKKSNVHASTIGGYSVFSLDSPYPQQFQNFSSVPGTVTQFKKIIVRLDKR